MPSFSPGCVGSRSSSLVKRNFHCGRAPGRDRSGCILQSEAPGVRTAQTPVLRNPWYDHASPRRPEDYSSSEELEDGACWSRYSLSSRGSSRPHWIRTSWLVPHALNVLQLNTPGCSVFEL